MTLVWPFEPYRFRGVNWGHQVGHDDGAGKVPGGVRNHILHTWDTWAWGWV